MKGLFPVKKLCRGRLVMINKDGVKSWIKNIIGIVVTYNNEKIIYSVLDDCFFRVIPGYVDVSFDDYAINKGKIFVQVYSFDFLGDEIYKIVGKDFITKEELISIKEKISGHFSDFDCDNLSKDTLLDYDSFQDINDYFIDTIIDYESKLNRSLIYDNCDIFIKSKSMNK